MIIAILAAGALMFQAAPAAAAAAPDAASPAPAPSGGVTAVTTAVVSKDKLVCHEEQLLGSRLTKKVCATASAVAQRKQEDRQTVEKWQTLRPYVSN
jgi:invasion protein IalB